MTLDEWIRASVTGLVLNGGASVRLGRDKATLPVEGRTLIERGLDHMALLFDEIVVVGRPEGLAPHPAVTQAVPDAVPGVGPLGGIATGLATMERRWGFFVACDMPRLDPEVMRRQLAVLRETRAEAVVPCWDGFWEPLHAAYA
ncbi:MAG: molybdenum cofactor guanylyltransferase, partial [Planctomycetota bacterium]